MDLDIMCAMLFGIVCGQILQAFMLAGIRDSLADLAWYAGLRNYVQAGHVRTIEDDTDF